MKKFKVTVIRTDEYEIEIDENILTPEEMKNWGEVFFPMESYEQAAKDFGVAFMRNEGRNFIEGYGIIKEFRRDGELNTKFQRNSEGNVEQVPESEYCKWISITPIEQDENYETEVEEINQTT